MIKGEVIQSVEILLFILRRRRRRRNRKRNDVGVKMMLMMRRRRRRRRRRKRERGDREGKERSYLGRTDLHLLRNRGNHFHL